MVINTLTMPPPCGRRGGVSSLLDVVNRRVIAKATQPGSRVGTFLEGILGGVDVAFPTAEEQEDVEMEVVKNSEPKGGKKKPNKVNLKQTYKRARKESVDDVQRALREVLVAKMREMRNTIQGSMDKEEVEVEVQAMNRIVGSGAGDWVEELMRLWGLPGEVGRLPFVAQCVNDSVEKVYTMWIAGKSHDERLWYMLGGVEGEGVRRESLELLIRILLTRRASQLYTDNMDVAIEAVLYAVNPEGFSRNYTVREFREAELCRSLRQYERDGSYELALDALDPGRFSSLIADVGEITRAQGGIALVHHNGVSRRVLDRYFESRELLTLRATKALMSRHGTGTGGRFTMGDFVRMYLALTDCSSITGIRYWFAVLDHDQDGEIGMSDVTHFYAERRSMGERSMTVVLADDSSLWTRLCASAKLNFRANGLRLHDLRAMNASDREFILCALLIRRLDDTSLINIKETLKINSAANPTNGMCPMIVS